MSEDEEHERIVQALIAGPVQAKKPPFEVPHDPPRLPAGLVELINTLGPAELVGLIFRDSQNERWVIKDVVFSRVEYIETKLIIRASPVRGHELLSMASADGMPMRAPADSIVHTYEIPLYLR